MISDFSKIENILTIISRVNEALSTSNEHQQLIEIVLDTLQETMEIDCCWVQLLRLEDRDLWLAAHRGFTRDMEGEIGSSELGQSFGNQVVGLGHKINITDLSGDGEYSLPSFSGAGFFSLVAVPIRTYRVQGLMGVASRDKKQFNAEFTELLTVIASQVGVALDKADLYQRARNGGKQLGVDAELSVVSNVAESSAEWNSAVDSGGVEDKNSADSGAIEEAEISLNGNTIRINGRLINLNPTEYKLMHCLVSNEGRALSYEELLTQVWGNEYRELKAFLRMYIQHLKLKLGSGNEPSNFIVDEPGVGYRFARSP